MHRQQPSSTPDCTTTPTSPKFIDKDIGIRRSQKTKKNPAESLCAQISYDVYSTEICQISLSYSIYFVFMILAVNGPEIVLLSANLNAICLLEKLFCFM